MCRKMVLQLSPSMDLKQNKLTIPKRCMMFGLFWVIFILLLLFLLSLIVGLFSYSDWESLKDVLKQPEFHFSLRFTLWTSLLATTAATIVALPSAYILSRYRLPGQAIFDTLLDIPIVLPPLVSGIALLIFFGPFFGEQLARIGIAIVFTPAGVIAAQWFIATPYAIKIFKQAFGTIDPRLENVARTLGFSPTMVFLKVTLPLAQNGIVAGIVMAWTRALGEFGATAMLAGITRMKTETLSVAVFLNMSIGDIKFAISTAIVMLLIALTVLIVLKTLLRNEVRI